jgi:hypothetical protein
VIAFSTAKDFFCLQTMHCSVFPEIILNWYCAFVCTMQDVHVIPVLTLNGHCWPHKGQRSSATCSICSIQLLIYRNPNLLVQTFWQPFCTRNTTIYQIVEIRSSGNLMYHRQ